MGAAAAVSSYIFLSPMYGSIFGNNSAANIPAETPYTPGGYPHDGEVRMTPHAVFWFFVRFTDGHTRNVSGYVLGMNQFFNNWS